MGGGEFLFILLPWIRLWMPYALPCLACPPLHLLVDRYAPRRDHLHLRCSTSTSELTARIPRRVVATTLGCGGGSFVTTSYGAPYSAPYGAPYAYGGGFGSPWQSGAPVGYNAYQYPTVWSGDHVVSGGQPEWASEDAAQHALNLANWRIKLLQAKLQQAKLASQVMNVGSPLSQTSAKVSSSDEAQLAGLRKGLASLAKQTTHAMSALAAKIDSSRVHHKTRASHDKLRMLKKDTDRELSDIRESAARHGLATTPHTPLTFPPCHLLCSSRLPRSCPSRCLDHISRCTMQHVGILGCWRPLLPHRMTNICSLSQSRRLMPSRRLSKCAWCMHAQ